MGPWKWFSSLWDRRRREDDLEREVRDHLELESQAQLDAGLLPEQARAAAHRSFGSATLIKEDTREAWGWSSLERFWQDIRYGARALRHSPGFCVVAILTLALGLGANTAIYSVVSAVLLRPLSFPEPDRLVRLWESNPAKGYHRNVVNPFNFLDWRARSRTMQQMAAVEAFVANLGAGAQAVAVPMLRVSPEFFSILEVPPFLGRALLPEEAVPGRDAVAVLSYELWQTQFGGDRNIVGKQIVASGAPLTVVGVMPPGFRLPTQPAKIWTPLPIERTEEWRGGRFLTVIGRLKPGVTLAQAQDEMTSIGAQLASENPFMDKGWSVEVIPMLSDATTPVRLPLLVLLAAVGFVLLIACANVSNLLLMRASARTREVAVRAALGAGRLRIMRQFLSESLLLAVAGWAVSVPVAYWSLRGLLLMLARHDTLPRMETIALDSRIFALGFSAALLTALLFGLVPAIHASRFDLQDALKQGSLRTGAGGNRLLRRGFVIAEVALALLLLIGAGLMLRSFAKLISVPTGFERERVLTMRFFVSPPKYADDAKRARYFERLLTEVRDVPGVQSAGSIHFLPLTGDTSGSCFGPLDEPHPKPSGPGAQFLVISPGYLESMGVPLLAGRTFDDGDRFGGKSVLMVNRAFARKFLNGQNPVGAQLNVCWTVPSPAQIVGVVADTRQEDLSTDAAPTIYVDNIQSPMYFATLVVRARQVPRQIASAVQAAIHRVDPQQAVSDVETMDQVFSDSVARPRLQLTLLTVFSGMALVLALLGVYGVVSYSVSRRTQELGVRVALGARRADITRLVLREGLVLAFAGIVIGLAAGVALTRVMKSLLFEVDATDPLTLATVSLLVLLVTAAAAFIPARRAAAIDPVTALRYE